LSRTSALGKNETLYQYNLQIRKKTNTLYCFKGAKQHLKPDFVSVMTVYADDCLFSVFVTDKLTTSPKKDERLVSLEVR